MVVVVVVAVVVEVKVKVGYLLQHCLHRLVTRSAFTIFEVAADWQKPMISQHIMQPSTALANEQPDPDTSWHLNHVAITGTHIMHSNSIIMKFISNNSRITP